jgi:hypothetical protein
MQIIRGPGTSVPLAEPCRPLGTVAELERAKIIERTTRGQLHRLRMAEMSTVPCTCFTDVFRVREHRPRLIPTGRADHYSASPIAGSLYPVRRIGRHRVKRALAIEPLHELWPAG